MATKTSKDIRNESRFMVLRAVYSFGTVSRAQIAAETGLSAATVTTLVGELLRAGVLREAGRISSRGGRPTATFQVDAERGRLIAVDVAETYVRLDLYDLGLGLVDREEIELEPGEQTIDSVSATIGAALGPLLSRNALRSEDLLHAGVSMPGQVDAEQGVDVFAPNWGWRDVPVLEALREAIGAPVRVDNPLMALATGELWFGAGRFHRDFVTVNLGTGVGAGIIVDGHLLRGRGNSAGEWGHTTLVWGGRSCHCGRKGCVESYIGAEGVRVTLEEIAPDHELLDVRHQRAFIEQLIRAEAAGDRAAHDVLERTGDYLAAGLGNLVNLLNPEHVSVLGWITRYAGAELQERVRGRIRQECLPGPAERVSIGFAETAAQHVRLGMAVLALEGFLADVGLPSASSIPPSASASASAVGTPRQRGAAPGAGWVLPSGQGAAARR